MHIYDPSRVRLSIGGMELKPADAVDLNDAGEVVTRPTMCQWCLAHPRPVSGGRCHRCGHVEGERMTGATARPGEPAPHGFSWVTQAVLFAPFRVPGYLID